MVQVRTTHAEIAERADAFLNAVGDAADRAERDRERESAEQGRPLPCIQFLTEDAADIPGQRRAADIPGRRR
jgi:hypothetical protein